MCFSITAQTRDEFQVWNKEVFGKVENEIHMIQNQLKLVQNSISSLTDIKREAELRKELEILMQREEVMWAQKARSDWVLFGDRNTRFFQTVVKQRQVKNRIMQLKRRDGSFTDDLGEIEDILAQHFKIVFEDNVPFSYDQILTEVGTLSLPQLSAHQLSSLDRPVTIEEIEDTVFQLGSHKAPGPDGIPAFFYHEYWSIVKFDIFNTVLAFFHLGSFLKYPNATYITLIPKVACPDNVNHLDPLVCVI